MTQLYGYVLWRRSVDLDRTELMYWRDETRVVAPMRPVLKMNEFAEIARALTSDPELRRVDGFFLGTRMVNRDRILVVTAAFKVRGPNHKRGMVVCPQTMKEILQFCAETAARAEGN